MSKLNFKKPGNRLKVASFGEVLFDVIDGTPYLGGAPLNLAAHLQKLGAQASLISAVGDDQLGNQALEEIKKLNLNTQHIAKLAEFETGKVTVELDAKKVATYNFAMDTAYDHIPLPQDLEEVDIFCFGTLAQRSEGTRANLKAILAKLDCLIFYDINLRQEFYTKEILEESLKVANILKINDEEFEFLTKMFNLELDLGALSDYFNIDMIILTLGPDGCKLYSDGATLYSPTFPGKVVSTVGAGDSFSAAFLYNFLNGETLEKSLEEGNRLATKIAGQKGAI